MRIQPINNNILTTKYSQSRFGQNPVPNTDDLSVKRDNAIIDFFEKKDQDKKYGIIASGIFLIAMLSLPFLIRETNRSEASRRAKKTLVEVKSRFESLKDDTSIPTLETCNSIDPKLRAFLQRIIDSSKVPQHIKEKAGNPQNETRLLLCGPTGVGKSFFAKIFAKTLDAGYTEVTYSHINSRWIGEDIEKMDALFNQFMTEAEASPNKKFVITFNEIDTIVQPLEILNESRGNMGMLKIDLRATFINYLDEIATRCPNITIIGTTNQSVKNLDSTIRSRFKNVERISFPKKNEFKEATKEILALLKIKTNLLTQDGDSDLDVLSQKMEDRIFSFRDFHNAVNKSKDEYMSDLLVDENLEYKAKYLSNAIDAIEFSDGEHAFNRIKEG